MCVSGSLEWKGLFVAAELSGPTKHVCSWIHNKAWKIGRQRFGSRLSLFRGRSALEIGAAQRLSNDSRQSMIWRDTLRL
jgi:hypothetical protein